MSGKSQEVQTEKREREPEDNGAAAPAAGAGSDVAEPAVKKLKATDGDATTAEPAPDAATTAAVVAVAPAAAAAAVLAETSAATVPSATEDTKDEAKPVKEEKAGGEAAPAPLSEEKIKELEESVLKMVEFYFGDSNFGWDRFLQSKAGKMGEKLVDISVLLTFNKLKTMVKDAGLSNEDGVALIARLGEASPTLRVSEDKKQIGRAEPMTEEGDKERVARTVHTKGYNKDAKITIEDVEKLFAEAGKARYVKICKASKGTKLTGIFVEFETKEQAEKAVELSDTLSHEGDVITVRLTKSFDQRSGEKSDKTPTPEEPVVYDAGKILHVVDLPESGVSRESLRDAVKAFGTVRYVDFTFGAREAYLRMDNASEAAAVLEGSKEGGLELAPGVEQKGTVSLVDGAEEKAYYERLEQQRADKFSRSNNRGRGGRGGKRGRGRGGGGRGRGRGRGGGGGDGGGGGGGD